MPRPIKPRTIAYKPRCRKFNPEVSSKEIIRIKFEELEAMRLKDVEKLFQEDCAEKMNVSRQTFQLIIESAREKVSKALLTGASIQIDGGNYDYTDQNEVCCQCGKKHQGRRCNK